MKTYKFRALKDDMSNCNFVYGQLVYDAIAMPRITGIDKSGQGLLFHTCLKDTEGQFTGQLDKNGKEIYESDMVKFIDNTTNPEKPIECITEVFWWGVMSCFALKNTHHEFNFTTVDEMEIIGNIHENPELS